MCGISGFVAQQNNSIPLEKVLKMTSIIRHRGPDDEGFMILTKEQKIIIAGGQDTPDKVWETQTEFHPTIEIGELTDVHALLSFGHRRLSILDLTPTGHQPMSYRKGEYWIIYNGEIYNYKQINIELEELGHHFNSRTDTETILAAYAEWGEACLNRFVGMWAFAIYDRKRNEVFLARDRYGIKPFYYYFSSNGDFYFGSEIKQFTVLNSWQPKLNSNRVYDQLVYSFTDHTDETMFSGVFQLPAGTCFRSTIDNIKPAVSGKVRYRRWYYPKRTPYKGSFSDASFIFKDLFETAVKEHLNADVLVGTALSGGLDSSAIVCEVNRILIAKGVSSLQKTFSSCSENEKYSEKKWMDIVVNHTNVDATFSFPRLKEVFPLTPQIIWHHDEPYQSQSSFLAYNVFRTARQNNVKVLLNGQGADEYLGGYGQFTFARYANMIKQFRISRMIEDITYLNHLKPISTSSLILGIASQFLPLVLKKRLTNFKSSTDHIKRIIDNGKLKADIVHPYELIPVKYRTVPEISEHLTFFSTLPKYLHHEDRNSMAHSVEARVPFLDHRLVEFSYNLPDDFLEKDGITKRVMREALSGLLPDQIKNRKDKMGFTTPEEHWVKNENPDLFRSKIVDAISITDGIIKKDALKYFDEVVRGRLPFDYTYWRIILFSEWIQRFQIKTE